MSDGIHGTLPPVRRWFTSLRAFSFTATIIPAAIAVTVAGDLAGAPDVHMVPWLIIPFTVAALLFHGGTNVLNDYWDYRHGVDGMIRGRPDEDPTHAISRGVVTPPFMLASGRMYFLLGILAGMVVAVVRGPGYLAAGLAGALGGYLYTSDRFSLKYRALGDITVFILMGPALVIMGVWALVGLEAGAATVVVRSTLPALPVALLVTAILHGNNLRDIQRDRDAGVLTVAGLLGFRRSRILFAILTLGSYDTVLILALLRQLPLASLAVLVTLRMAWRLTRRVLEAERGDELMDLPMRAAQLHLLFGVVLVASLALGAVTPWG